MEIVGIQKSYKPLVELSVTKRVELKNYNSNSGN